MWEVQRTALQRGCPAIRQKRDTTQELQSTAGFGKVGFDQVIASQLEVCATIDALEEAEKLQTALLLARGCDLLNMRRDGWRGVADYDPAESLVRRQTALKALADAKTSVWSAAQRLRA
jgi:hypothetical protein